MFCPKCSAKTKVIDSRSCEEEVFRKRKCIKCGYIFYTEEFESDESIEGMRYIWSENTRKRRQK